MADALQKWAQQGMLSKAQLSSDGKTLTLDDSVLDASQATEVSSDGKSCHYTLGSLFLQVVDPDQGLMAYRNACKARSVADPVKALDKPTVVAFFLGGAPQQQAPVAEAASAPSAPEPSKKEAKPSERRSDKSRRSKHEKRHESSKRHRDSRDKSASSERKKKQRKAPMTNEQLFSNLNVVVDKRASTQEQQKQQEIHKALSAEGFDVTPELLAEHKAALETMIMAHEIPVGNSASILRPATAVDRDFSRVLELYNETVKPPTSSKKHKPTAAPSSSTDRSYLIGKKPIIVLPKGMSAPITMANGYEFFCNAKFVPRASMKGSVQKPPTTFTRTVGTKRGVGGAGMVEYELMDNPTSKLGQDSREWQRVVAVIALGASWQFKDWPGRYSDPVVLFGRTYGFYIGMEGDKIPTELEGWAVRKGRLNRDKRGLDSVTYASCWNGLDEWMAIHKPELLPQKTGH